MPRITLEDSDETLSLLRDSVSQFSVQHDGPRTMRTKREGIADVDKVVWSAMAQAGWTALMLPEELGGMGLGVREQAILSEGLGRALIAEPVARASVMAGAILAGVPDSTERRRLAEGLAAGSLILAPAWQDKPDAQMSCAASGQGHLVLSGTKQFVEAARSATDLLVFAATANGSVLLSVPTSAPGVFIADRPGIDGAAISSVSFVECFVSPERVLLRGEGCETLLSQAISTGRLALAAELAGIGSRAFELTREYTKNRVQFGKPIASFQSIQHRLVDMWMDAELACAAVANAVEAVRTDFSAGELAVLAAKARAGDAAFSICRRAVHLYGAMGFTDECDIGLYLKRAISLNASLGQPEQLRLQFVELERAA